MIRLVLTLLALCIAQPALAQPDWTYRRDTGEGVHLRILKDYHLAAGATATEPIVVIGGRATIDGYADEVVVVGGSLRVGPTAVIDGDIVTVGGEAVIDPAARINGDIQETVVLWPRIDIGFADGPAAWWAILALAFLLLRLGLALVLSLFLAWMAPAAIGRLGQRAADGALSASALGLAGQLLFIPAALVFIVALAISVIGIPLLAAVPFAVAAALLGWVGGFAAVAARVGRRVRRADAADAAPGLDVVVGYTALTAVSVIAHLLAFGPVWMMPIALAAGAVGLLIEWIAWTIGLGALLATILARRQPSMPPALPALPPAPAPSTS